LAGFVGADWVDAGRTIAQLKKSTSPYAIEQRLGQNGGVENVRQSMGRELKTW
jgi:hypothetical protein